MSKKIERVVPADTRAEGLVVDADAIPGEDRPNTEAAQTVDAEKRAIRDKVITGTGNPVDAGKEF